MSAVFKAGRMFGWLSIVATAWLLVGCASTPKIDWNTRVGTYSYDQAVIDLGPPDKQAKLANGVVVAEWMTRRGYAYPYSPFPSFSYYHWYYGPWYHYPYYLETYNTPDAFLRLVFNAQGKLASYKNFYR
jgi:hypothetical protein